MPLNCEEMLTAACFTWHLTSSLLCAGPENRARFAPAFPSACHVVPQLWGKRRRRTWKHPFGSVRLAAGMDADWGVTSPCHPSFGCRGQEGTVGGRREEIRQRLGSARDNCRTVLQEMQKAIEAVKSLHPLGIGNMMVAVGAEFF